MDYKLYIYAAGCVIAAIVGLIDFYKANKEGESVDEFPGIYTTIILLSWMSVALYALNYFKKYIRI